MTVTQLSTDDLLFYFGSLSYFFSSTSTDHFKNSIILIMEAIKTSVRFRKAISDGWLKVGTCHVRHRTGT